MNSENRLHRAIPGIPVVTFKIICRDIKNLKYKNTLAKIFLWLQDQYFYGVSKCNEGHYL